MLQVIWGIIKVILYIILFIFLTLLALLVLALVVPVCYKIKAHSNGKVEDIKGEFSIGWLFNIIYVKALYDKEISYKVRLFGIPIMSDKPKESEPIKDTAQESGDSSDMPQKTTNLAEAEEEQVLKESFQDVVLTQDDVNNEPVQDFAFEPIEPTKKIKENKNIGTKSKTKKEKDSSGLSGIIDKIKDFYKELKDETNVAAFKFVKEQIFKILKHVKPRKIKVDLIFGFDDPSTTGIVLGIISLIYPKVYKDLNLTPDFEKKIFDGRIFLKGRIVLGVITLGALRVLFNKDVKSVIKKFRNK